MVWSYFLTLIQSMFIVVLYLYRARGYSPARFTYQHLPPLPTTVCGLVFHPPPNQPPSPSLQLKYCIQKGPLIRFENVSFENKIILIIGRLLKLLLKYWNGSSRSGHGALNVFLFYTEIIVPICSDINIRATMLIWRSMLKWK